MAGGPGGGGGAMGGAGGGGMGTLEVMIGLGFSEILTSDSDTRCLSSLCRATSVSNFSLVRSKLASTSSFSCVFTSSSASFLANWVANSRFSFSSSSALLLNSSSSSSFANLKLEKKQKVL